MCNKSESIIEIAKALIAFQGEVKPIDKDGTNPHFRSSYTTLDNMIDETKPILQKHGLTVMQFPGGDGEKVTIRTMILHTSGEWIESEPLVLRPTKNDPQGIGSAITYGRRYSYASALSLSLGDDDDGNAASTPTQNTYNNSQGQRQHNPPTSQQNGGNGHSGQSQGETAARVAARVYKLREEMGWSWQDLTDYATDVLQRELKFLKKDITDIAEWKKIEEAMKITRDGIDQTSDIPLPEEVPF